MAGFAEYAAGLMGRPAAVKVDKWEIFLRQFSRGPERQQVQEYLRDLRSAAFEDHETAVLKGNQTAVIYWSGQIRAFEELIKWLSKYDNHPVAEE